MQNKYVFEGRTTNEAIEKGLKELKVSKDKVQIKVLESEEKRSFFSILTPRVVKIEMELKQAAVEEKVHIEKEYHVSEESVQTVKERIEKFLLEFLKNSFAEVTPIVEIKEDTVYVELEGDESSKLIGYRGESLNALQTILSTIANKGISERVRVVVNIAGYKEKREKTLQELAQKVSKTVLRTGKSITLEPMTAYERKIIHNALQKNHRVTTHSVGEDPHRRIVIAKK